MNYQHDPERAYSRSVFYWLGIRMRRSKVKQELQKNITSTCNTHLYYMISLTSVIDNYSYGDIRSEHILFFRTHGELEL